MAAPATGRRSRRDAGLVIGAGAAMLLIFVVIRGSLTDDAYITLAYAKNLALHLHWGLIPDEIANTATSPLNTVVLGAAAAVTRVGGGVHPVLALGAVSVGLAMLMAWGWIRTIRALGLPFVTAVLGVALVLVNPFLLSAVGLEVLMIPVLLVLLLAMAVEGRPVWFGVVGGLAVLARLDLIVFVVPIGLAAPAVRAAWLRVAATVVAVVAPWFLFSWIYLGSAVPDTLLIKVSQPGLFGHWTYANGPFLYLKGKPTEVALAFVPAVLGAVALAVWFVTERTRLRPAAALGLGGIAYYGAYSVIGVGPYHWYYVAPMAALAMWLAVWIGGRLRPAAARVRLPRRLGLAAAAVAGGIAIGNLAVDAGQGIPWRSPVIFGNWASAKDYARVGKALHRRIGSAVVASPGEIGTLAYFCDCAIVDDFSDRGGVMRKVNEHIDGANPVTRLLIKLDYAWSDRGQEPRHVDYALRYGPGPGSGRDVWQVWSAARGVGHFVLVPVPGPAQ